ncbi:MAG: hypothetical protein A3G94_01555 [Deltaproteobacteria bacterium RIFCSPLOWO2_12_FULL_60_16]|nr:MAG: hypothetical protein A3G94_01555 [Deltaproteobacteria bacterium RIFCSPLOWO2_12_FULL_60_16]
MVSSFGGNQQAIPWLITRCQDEDEPSMKIATLAAEHRLLDKRGLFCQRLNHPVQRVRSTRLSF